MKAALLLLMVATGYAGYGQVVIKKKENTPTQDRLPPIHTVAPGVYALKPDNMACVVPDMEKVKPMPNSVKPGDDIGFIPNAYDTKPIDIAQKKKPLQRKKSDK